MRPIGNPHSVAVVLTGRVTRDPATTGPVVDDSFVSGDAVALDLRMARIGSRGLARLIDLFVQGGLILLFILIGTAIAVASGMDGAESGTLQVVMTVVAFLGYPVIMQTVANGRTLGKLALGLRVVRDDGGPIHFRHALTRELVGVASEWPGLLPPLTWFASLWCMLVSPRSKRIGDIAAGTLVIHERTPLVWGWVPIMPPHLAGWAGALDLSGVSDDLALAIRQYLVRHRFLHQASRIRLGVELTTEVVARITPMPPGGITGRDFLSAVIAERHARSVRRLSQARASTAAVWPELMALTRTPLLAVPFAAPRLPQLAPAASASGPGRPAYGPGPGNAAEPANGGARPDNGGPRLVAPASAWARPGPEVDAMAPRRTTPSLRLAAPEE
jgi:uncharacterized RDD family membrane protein YckC